MLMRPCFACNETSSRACQTWSCAESCVLSLLSGQGHSRSPQLASTRHIAPKCLKNLKVPIFVVHLRQVKGLTAACISCREGWAFPVRFAALTALTALTAAGRFFQNIGGIAIFVRYGDKSQADFVARSLFQDV